MTKQLLTDLGHKMDHTIDVLRKELAGIRTSKASPALLDAIRVEAYGTMVPLNQVASVSTPDPKTIAVQPWDKQMLVPIERAIQKSDIGLMPKNDGTVLHLPIPPLTEERRRDYVKLVKKLGEDAKISIRNVRRDMNERVKKEEKAGTLSEDESKRLQKTVQEVTDQHITTVDQAIQKKDAEIMEI
ncbi:MAG: ribosome recycling factor [Candidatus Latescibacteria bacterium]|nr:ribosome recycling factor [Candidatus Latescibacterota bacterium]